jgi:hypothetical protein
MYVGRWSKKFEYAFQIGCQIYYLILYQNNSLYMGMYLGMYIVSKTEPESVPKCAAVSHDVT